MFDWLDYFFLGQDLAAACQKAGATTPEARRRSAVSRAYYAAYHIAQRRYREIHKKEPPYGHEPLWQSFFERGIGEADKDAAIQGQKLHGMRNLADYKARQSTDRDVAEALRLSSEICTAFGHAPTKK
jgi:hypothetical protein